MWGRGVGFAFWPPNASYSPVSMKHDGVWQMPNLKKVVLVSTLVEIVMS